MGAVTKNSPHRPLALSVVEKAGTAAAADTHMPPANIQHYQHAGIRLSYVSHIRLHESCLLVVLTLLLSVVVLLYEDWLHHSNIQYTSLWHDVRT